MLNRTHREISIHEARHIIDDLSKSMIFRIEAASVMSLSDHATLADLMSCLRHRGVIGELAAVGLFRRTGRPKPKRLRDFANVDQWEQYLIRRRLEMDAEDSG